MSNYTSKRGTPEAVATLLRINATTVRMYDVITSLVTKTIISILRTYYKGPRWVFFHDGWFQLCTDGGTLTVEDEDGIECIFSKGDLIDILDQVDSGEVYADKCGRRLRPPYAPLLVNRSPGGGGSKS